MTSTTHPSTNPIPRTGSSDTPLHVVFGAGQIGAGLARSLRDLGMRVRVVRRSDRSVGEGIEVWAGDARDPEFATRAAARAAVIYQCTNPSKYSGRTWARELPELGEAILAATRSAGARLVVLDNLYAYGPHDGSLTDDTSMEPAGRKGAARMAWHERLMRAAEQESTRIVIGRAGDYFGPGADGAIVSEASVRGLVAGKRPALFGDPDQPHAFSYIPDVIASLIELGTAAPDVEGQVFHLPVVEIASAELYQRLADALGVSVRPRRIGRTLLRVLSPVMPAAREMLETFYQWDRPFLVADRRFRIRFPNVGATLEEMVEATAKRARVSATHSSKRMANLGAGVASAVVLALVAPVHAGQSESNTPPTLDRAETRAPVDGRSGLRVDAEVDPSGYALGGYSLHLGVGFRRVRADLGMYAMKFPEFLGSNDDFDLFMDGFGLKLQYFLQHEARGAFVGIDGSVAHALAQLKGTSMAKRQTLAGVGVDFGYRISLPAHFYITPWLGLGYEINADDVMLAGKTLHVSRLTVFPAVHLGYRFR